MDKDGLKIKYNVTKISDGSAVTDCFVLRPEKDMAARVALKTYALYCNNKQLATDINAWIDSMGRI